MRYGFFSLVSLLAVGIVPAGVAEAQPTLISGLGGTAGYGMNMVARGDAENVEVILGTAFPSGISILGTSYSSVWVNTDGNVSFGGAQGYRPDAFPGSLRPMIAAWFADVDTTPGPQSGDPAGANTVYWDLRTDQLTVTWFLVGYYSGRTDRRVSVQLLMRQAVGQPAGVVNVEIRYNQCGWYQGMRADSIPAQAGFDLGDRTRYLALPYSGEFAVVEHICNGTNAGLNGFWRFRSDALPAPMCGNFMRETGEQCDDGNAPGPPCEDDCSRTAAMMSDATWLPEGGRPDAAFPFPDAQIGPGEDGGGGSGMDGGGGGGDGDGGGGGGDGDGGGGGPGSDELDVFGGCSIAHGRAHASLGLILLALAALAIRRSSAGR